MGDDIPQDLRMRLFYMIEALESHTNELSEN